MLSKIRAPPSVSISGLYLRYEFSRKKPLSFVFSKIRLCPIHKIPLGVCSFILVDWAIVGETCGVRLSGLYTSITALFSFFRTRRVKRKTQLTFRARPVSSLNKRSPSLSPILCFPSPLYLWLAYTYILVRYVFRLETSK